VFNLIFVLARNKTFIFLITIRTKFQTKNFIKFIRDSVFFNTTIFFEYALLFEIAHKYIIVIKTNYIFIVYVKLNSMNVSKVYVSIRFSTELHKKICFIFHLKIFILNFLNLIDNLCNIIDFHYNEILFIWLEYC